MTIQVHLINVNCNCFILYIYKKLLLTLTTQILMLLIFLSWIYIFITTLNFGILFKKIVRITDCNVIIHHFLGLFFYTLITSIAAFFIRINIEFYSVVFFLNLAIFLSNKQLFIKEIKSLINTIKKLGVLFKIVLLGIFIITLAQSATAPYLLDNESYYIQTIKWVNEFGYVKGLANLHMFFAQNSAWHTLQAGFNFPFLSDDFNDLNGFVFILISILSLEKINNNKESFNTQELSFGLLLFFTVFFMQFVNTPSPDLIVFTLTPYIFFLFIKQYSKFNINSFKVILSLVLFLCLIKVTIASIVFLVVLLFIKNFKTLKKHIFEFTILSSLVLVIFLAKNTIISGYLLFPIETIDLFNFDWKQPKELVQFYNYGTYLAGFDNQEVRNFGLIDRFIFWLKISKLHGIFNKIYILLLVTFPFFILKIKTKKPITIIYFLAILQLIILWGNSPQYRFFFVFIIFLSLQIVVLLFKNKNVLNYFFAIAVFLSAIPLFFEFNLSNFTKNSFAMKLSNFEAKNMLFPEGKSKINTPFTFEIIDGFEFYSPSDDAFFWATGNGNLPCVNKNQVNYIKETFNYMPQLRTNNLKDGFKSIKTTN